MAKWTPAQVKARQKMVNQKSQVRDLLVAGNVAEAEALAKEGGFDIFAARLAPVYKNKCEPYFAALEQAYAAGKEFAGAMQPVAQPVLGGDGMQAPPDNREYVGQLSRGIPSDPASLAISEPIEVNGWPTLTDAIVWSFPPNKNLCVIQLPDKRTASMYRGRKTWHVYDRLTARLVNAQADPVYEVAKVAKASW